MKYCLLGPNDLEMDSVLCMMFFIGYPRKHEVRDSEYPEYFSF